MSLLNLCLRSLRFTFASISSETTKYIVIQVSVVAFLGDYFSLPLVNHFSIIMLSGNLIFRKVGSAKIVHFVHVNLTAIMMVIPVFVELRFYILIKRKQNI